MIRSPIFLVGVPVSPISARGDKSRTASENFGASYT